MNLEYSNHLFHSKWIKVNLRCDMIQTCRLKLRSKFYNGLKSYIFCLWRFDIEYRKKTYSSNTGFQN